MKSYMLLILMGIISFQFALSESALAAQNNEPGAPTIAVTKMDISDKALRLDYEIRNNSQHEVWICEAIFAQLHDSDFEAYMAEDKQTLLIRRRLDINPLGSVVVPPDGRYVRLRAGESRNETLLLSLPVESRFFWSFTNKPGKAYAKSIALEIGYYPGDMPGIIRDVLIEAERFGDKKLFESPIKNYEGYEKRLAILECYLKGFLIENKYGGLLEFNWLNWIKELVRHRGEELVIRWTGGGFRMGEQVLRITIDGLRIPYEEKYDRPKVSPPDLNLCTRIDIRYQPSVLDYFFPFPNERDLLSAEEVKYLQSLQRIVADNQEHIKAFASEVKKESPGGIFTERSTARVICYRDGERLTSFTIYDDRSIVTEEEQCIRYKTGLPSLKLLTPQIQPFQLRLECADNLKNLWSLLRFLYKKRFWYITWESYSPSKWCATIVRDGKVDYISKGFGLRYFKCPSAGEGKNHYAMNPKCKPDSPPDTVLLFETKAGWNQHGGPELFTFDNHEPRGGCVLFNDGTVKFIRSKEELQQLRWK